MGQDAVFERDGSVGVITLGGGAHDPGADDDGRTSLEAILDEVRADTSITLLLITGKNGQSSVLRELGRIAAQSGWHGEAVVRGSNGKHPRRVAAGPRDERGRSTRDGRQLPASRPLARAARRGRVAAGPPGN